MDKQKNTALKNLISAYAEQSVICGRLSTYDNAMWAVSLIKLL